MAKFKKEILEIMQTDSVLYSQIAQALGILPGSLAPTIRRNGNNINQYSIVTLVASHLGKNPEELLEEEFATVNK